MSETISEAVRNVSNNIITNRGTTSSLVVPICRYFLKGICRFAETCHFQHSIMPGQSDVYPELNVSSSVHTAPSTSDISSSEREKSKIIPTDPNSWVMAPEFVPNCNKKNNSPTTIRTYAEVVNMNNTKNTSNNQTQPPSNSDGSVLCPYLMGSGVCRLEVCVYDHGELCELCGKYCLHPTDKEQRKKHNNECIAQHEKDMELSFAIQRSKDKTCGVCFEIIMEKAGKEQRFGILPNCNHCFCLECIRKWRQAKQFDNKIIRACPECRVCSDFVCPSVYWVNTKEEKDKLITDYKHALGEKDCKYFKQGQGKCPFGNKCFYRHALSNGITVDVGGPPRPIRRFNNIGEFETLQHVFFWDFIQERDHILLDDLVSFFSDSDDSDYSYAYDEFMIT